MKTTTRIFIISLSWLMCASLATAQDDKEKMAIKAAIEKETTAFFQTDYKTWIDCWAHVPYAYWSVSDTSGFNTYEGWKAIEIGFTDYFVTSKPSTAKIERKWHDIRVYGTGAYARFVQYTTDEGATVVEDELRILENQNNQWKIVLVGVMKGMQKGKLAP
jgi:hypothetical protein